MKILIEMKHGIGDCVCMLPVVAAVRRKYPNAYIAMMVNSDANREIFMHSNVGVDKFYYLSIKFRPIQETIKTLYLLYKEAFDIGIASPLTPRGKARALFKLIGVKNKIGEQFLSKKIRTNVDYKHFVDCNFHAVKKLNLDESDRQPKLYIEDKNMVKCNKKCIAVNIGNADKNYYRGDWYYTRNWGEGKMHNLVKKLCGLDVNILLLGGRQEIPLLREYEDILNKDNVFDYVGKTTIEETMKLLRMSDLSVGVDTGMQHVADALGVKTVSIFGPTNPHTHGAYSKNAIFVQRKSLLDCQYCFATEVYYKCPRRSCLLDISEDEVFRIIKKSI